MIDTHAHLQGLSGGPAAAVAAAAAAGVERIVCIGAGPEEARQAVELAARHQGVYATVGLHPHDAEAWDDELEAELERLAALPKVVAIGECGLDYHRDRAPRPAQERAFVAQIALAERCGLPLVVHTRDAADDTLAHLRRARCRVVLHCFSLPDRLEEAVERGWYVSFAGNVTYPSAGLLRDAARRVPASLLLLETDAPYLAPVPHRGRPNAPAYVMDTLRAVAGLRGVAPAELAASVDRAADAAFAL